MVWSRVPRVRIEDAAIVELLDAREWYTDVSTSAALEFAKALSAALELLPEYPESGRIYLAGTRRVLVPGFPYSIVYRVESDAVVVFAVAYTSRRPGYWRGRL